VQYLREEPAFPEGTDPAMFEFKGLALGARERIAGSVYGTIVVLAVLADEADAFEHHLWKLEAIVLASVLILWIAHTYAHGLGESLRLGRRLTGNELRAIISRELAIPLASVLPVAAIAIGALRDVGDVAAVWVAISIGVVTLTIQGVRFAKLERLSFPGTLAAVAVNLSLVLMIVALKVLVSH
jgi:hypothetical protein